jgi:hypothetical protein
MHYYYTLNIPGSYANFSQRYIGNGDSFNATNQFTVAINDNSIWNSTTNFDGTSNGISYVTSGEAMPWTITSNDFSRWPWYTDFVHSDTVSFNNYTTSIDLGVWGADQSFTLSYIILSSVSVNAPDSCSYSCFSFSAGINDPSSLSGVPVLGNNVTTVTPSAVPVPAAVWLFGSGLLGLFGTQRRKEYDRTAD